MELNYHQITFITQVLSTLDTKTQMFKTNDSPSPIVEKKNLFSLFITLDMESPVSFLTTL